MLYICVVYIYKFIIYIYIYIYIYIHNKANDGEKVNSKLVLSKV